MTQRSYTFTGLSLRTELRDVASPRSTRPVTSPTAPRRWPTYRPRACAPPRPSATPTRADADPDSRHRPRPPAIGGRLTLAPRAPTPTPAPRPRRARRSPARTPSRPRAMSSRSAGRLPDAEMPDGHEGGHVPRRRRQQGPPAEATMPTTSRSRAWTSTPTGTTPPVRCSRRRAERDVKNSPRRQHRRPEGRAARRLREHRADERGLRQRRVPRRPGQHGAASTTSACISQAPGLTIRNSTFRNCATMDISSCAATGGGSRPTADVTLENNVFGALRQRRHGWHYYGLSGPTAPSRTCASSTTRSRTP